MDSVIEMHSNVAAALLFVFFPLIILVCLWRSKWKALNEAPEPSGRLPVIGHLHLLRRGQKPLFEILEQMADRHGPVFMLRLGTQRRLILCSWTAAKDCLLTHDKVVATRPRTFSGEYLGYNYAMLGFAPYGEYWRSVRKITMELLLSNARVEMLAKAREAEIGVWMLEMHELWRRNQQSPAGVDIGRLIRAISNNTVCRAVVGKRYFGSIGGGGGSSEALRFSKAIGDLVHELLVGFVPVMADAIPFLRSVMDWQGHEAKMRSAARQVDALMEELLEEHRQKRRFAADADSDFMDAMLGIMEDNEFSGMDRDTVIKATALSLIVGGADNPATITTRTLALLLRHPEALKRVQEELDLHVGKERRVDESDARKLVYLHAAVKEAFRLYPPAPLLITREATADCEISGFRCAAGTQVLVHVRKLQRDPSVWGDDAGEFRPERFLPPSRHAGVDVRGRHLELIPFGAGRRACPGVAFSMQLVHITLARLIQGFEMEVAGAGSVEEKGGGGGNGMDLLFTAHNVALELVITPRLRDALYYD